MKQPMIKFAIPISMILISLFLLMRGHEEVNANVSVPASAIQRWQVSNGYYGLHFFGDGTILATDDFAVPVPGVFAGGVNAVTMNSDDGSAIQHLVASDVRSTIRLSNAPADQDWIIGGYANKPAFRQDGTYVKDLFALGCCNVTRHPFAYDHVNDRGWLGANGAAGTIDISTDVNSWRGTIAPNSFGGVSLADASTAYTYGQQGAVVKTDVVTGFQWSAVIDSVRLRPGAVQADGSFVVTSGFGHFEGTTTPGRLARILPNGTVAFNSMVNAVTPPVVGGNGLIFVGTQAAPINENGPGAIEAYDPSGNLVWSVPVAGLPNDLLVGDDGAVYAAAGSFADGRIYAIGQDDGIVRRTITDVQGAWEIVLRAGHIYASGKSPTYVTSITALPVAANNYDPSSSWPVRFHDNQRTSNRTHPILNPPRLPLPDSIAPSTTADPSTAANASGWNNTDVGVTLSAADNSGGSGVRSITYSASGAQNIPVTIVNGQTATVGLTAEGMTTISYFAEDNAGNVEILRTFTVRIDKSAPTISITSPTIGTYLVNQSATVSFTCADGFSGIDACSGSVADGSPLDTSSTGAHIFTVNATDNAGNSANTTISYTVVYGVEVLYDQTRAHKSGSTIPIKIRLVDASGASVSSPTILPHAVSVMQTSSLANVAFGDAGDSNPDFDFRFDPAFGGYIYNLKTTGFGTGSYILKFVAGSDPTIYVVGFQVRK